MAAPVFTGTLFHTLKKTLRKIIKDKEDGLESSAYMPRVFTEGSMEDNWIDDLETSGPGLASEKTEGASISLGTIQEGAPTRYLARTFAQKVIVTREAMEDVKYPEALNVVKRLKRAMVKTYDIDATMVFVRATNTSYVGGDGQALASTTHTLPQGGTFSNKMTVPLSPSVQAMTLATAQMRKYPGHDGITEGVMPKCIHCPVDQWAVWEELTRSKMDPIAGNYSRVNVVNSVLNIQDVVANPYWSNTTTNWAIISDADNGLNFLWRRRVSSDDWVDNDQQLYKFSVSARWSRGWSDPRCVLFVDA